MPVVKNTQTVDGQEVTIFIEIEQAPERESIYGDLRDSKLEKAAEKVIEVADDVFGRGLKLAHSCAIRVVDSIKEMDGDVRPDEYEVQLAIRLNAGVAHIVDIGSEAQMHVTMKWTKPKEQP